MAEIDIKVAPIADAVESITRRTILPTKLGSADIARVIPLELREAAQFSAKVENVRYLQYIQDQVEKKLSLTRRGENGAGAFVSREKFIAELRQIARDEGIAATDGRQGTLQDPASFARAKLIYDTQIQRAAGYAKWQRDQNPNRLVNYPCQELIRIGERRVPRDWQARWLAEGGKLFAGRMIAAKNDKIWTGISRFRTPWPPFDFNSGMGLRDISRSEAEQLSVIPKDTVIAPSEVRFNDTLQASLKGIKPANRQPLIDEFGDQIVIDGDTVKWQGHVIRDLFEQSKDLEYKARISLGKTSPAAVEKFKELGIDLSDYEFDLSADDIRHARKKHGPPGVDAKGRPVGERNGTQRPITAADFEALPFVLRSPDIVGQGLEPDTFALTKDLDGNLISIWITRSLKTLKTNLQSLWKKN